MKKITNKATVKKNFKKKYKNTKAKKGITKINEVNS